MLKVLLVLVFIFVFLGIMFLAYRIYSCLGHLTLELEPVNGDWPETGSLDLLLPSGKRLTTYPIKNGLLELDLEKPTALKIAELFRDADDPARAIIHRKINVRCIVYDSDLLRVGELKGVLRCG